MRSFSTRFHDTVGDSLQAIRPGRPKYHLRTAVGKHECGRFANPTACARNYDNLAFDSCHKLLPLRPAMLLAICPGLQPSELFNAAF
jgi:hypothetical protein